MAETYGTTVIPSEQVTVQAGGTVSVGTAFNTSLGLVGGMNVDEGTATPGEVERVETLPDATELFGAESELARAVEVVGSQSSPPSELYVVGVSETEQTESVTASESGTLGGSVLDPNVHPEHEITAEETTNGTQQTVEIVYESAPSSPSTSDTVAVNPVTGEFAAASSGDYDVTYTTGDYESAIDALDLPLLRTVGVLTERQSVANYLRGALNNAAQNFDFVHGVVGAMPEADAAAYTSSLADRRLSLVAPSRGFVDAANTQMVRTVAAVAGLQSGSVLGSSTTYDALGGLVDLNTVYTNSELGSLIDAGVEPLSQSGNIKIVKDMTTAEEAKFERVYASEIIDEAIARSSQASEAFIGDRNTDTKQLSLRESHASAFDQMIGDSLLEGYSVSVTEVDNFTVDVNIAIEVVGVIDTVAVTITVADVIQNGGAA